MSQVNYQATYKYLIVYILEMILWIRPCPGTRKCHSWRECSWRYAHNFLLLFQFSDVLYFCNNALGLAEVRLGKRNGHVTWTEDSRPSFSLFTLSANSFTFPTEPVRKNSSENHTKRCFSVLWQRECHVAGSCSLCCPGLQMHAAKAPAWPRRKPPPWPFEGHYSGILTISNWLCGGLFIKGNILGLWYDC